MSAPVQPGDILAGKYRVERILGEGGMGVVVAATDIQLERRVAIKFLLKTHAGHPEASQRFLREARAAVKIQSEHIARVIDVGTMEGGEPYMVMEYLEGADLAGLVEKGGAVSVEEAVGHVLEACDAIAEAHFYGIIHRDLKPANLFLASQPDGSSKVKVLDFGISKATMGTSDSGLDPSLTRTASMMGSPLYMSPEQMRSAKNVDSRTDIWALGVILYELLAGEPPFVAETIPELSAKVLLEEPAPLSARRTDLPSGLEAVVARCLAKDPAERYATVAELAVALGPFASSRGRANIERITRLLNATGGGAPNLKRNTEIMAGDAGAVAATMGAETAAAWENARGGGAKGGRLWLTVAGALAVLALGGGVLVSRMGSRNEASASAASASSEVVSAGAVADAAATAETEPEGASGGPSQQTAGANQAREDAGKASATDSTAIPPKKKSPAVPRVAPMRRPRPPAGQPRRVPQNRQGTGPSGSEEPPSLRSRFGSRK